MVQTIIKKLVPLFLTLLISSTGFASNFDNYFVTQSWLRNNLGRENLVILDAREKSEYKRGHIKGALQIGWKQISDMKPAFAHRKWGTVTDKKLMTEIISGAGITERSEIIVYSDTHKGWGEDGRLLWTLKVAGLNNIKILDGGIRGWIKSGGKIYSDRIVATRSDFVVRTLKNEISIETTELKRRYGSFKLIDSRTIGEFKGARRFGEKRGGHLPGAILLPYKDFLRDGYLKPEKEIAKILAKKGIGKGDNLVTYCTAGVRSAYVQVVLEMMGYKVKNYDESFYIWAMEKDTKLGIKKGDNTYNFITSKQLKKDIGLYFLMDLQPGGKTVESHFKGAYKTGAHPVKTRADKLKLKKTIPLLKSTKKEIVIIDTQSEKSAIRAFNYLRKNGISSARLYILENSKRFWFF